MSNKLYRKRSSVCELFETCDKGGFFKCWVIQFRIVRLKLFKGISFLNFNYYLCACVCLCDDYGHMYDGYGHMCDDYGHACNGYGHVYDDYGSCVR